MSEQFNKNEQFIQVPEFKKPEEAGRAVLDAVSLNFIEIPSFVPVPEKSTEPAVRMGEAVPIDMPANPYNKVLGFYNSAKEHKEGFEADQSAVHNEAINENAQIFSFEELQDLRAQRAALRAAEDSEA